MTTTFVSGSVLRLSISDDAGVSFDILLHAQSGQLQFQRNTSDIVTKDIGGGSSWGEVYLKEKTGTLSCQGLTFYDVASGESNVVALFTHFNAGTKLDFKWTTGVTGDPILSGECYCTQYSETAEANTESSFDAQFTITGAVTAGTVA